MGGLGMPTPRQMPLSMQGGLVPGSPLQLPKSADAQVPYTKWHKTVHTVSCQHLRDPQLVKNEDVKLWDMEGQQHIYWGENMHIFIEKSEYKWTNAVQT